MNVYKFDLNKIDMLIWQLKNIDYTPEIQTKMNYHSINIIDKTITHVLSISNTLPFTTSLDAAHSLIPTKCNSIKIIEGVEGFECKLSELTSLSMVDIVRGEWNSSISLPIAITTASLMAIKNISNTLYLSISNLKTEEQTKDFNEKLDLLKNQIPNIQIYTNNINTDFSSFNINVNTSYIFIANDQTELTTIKMHFPECKSYYDMQKTAKKNNTNYFNNTLSQQTLSSLQYASSSLYNSYVLVNPSILNNNICSLQSYSISSSKNKKGTI